MGSRAGLEMEVGEGCDAGTREKLWEEEKRLVSVVAIFQERVGCLQVSDFPSLPLSFLI